MLRGLLLVFGGAAFRHDDLQVAEPFLDTGGLATAARHEAAHHDRLAHLGMRHDQPVDVELVVVLGIGDRALQRLASPAWAMRRLLNVSVATAWLAGLLRISPATRFSLRGETRMLRSDRLRLRLAQRAFVLRLAHVSPASPSCPPSGR